MSIVLSLLSVLCHGIYHEARTCEKFTRVPEVVGVSLPLHPQSMRAAPCTVASTCKCCWCACCSSTSCTSHLGERHPVRSFSFQLDRNFLEADKLHGSYSKHTIEWKFPLPVQELYSSFMGISIQRRSRGLNFGLGNLPGSRAGSANCWMVLVDR